MSEKKPQAAPAKPKSFGWIAEYVDEHSLLIASRKVRDSGYTKTDAYTPFPVHGIDEALGIKPTILPFIVLGAGFTGLFTALILQYWTNAYDYKYIISGKPFASWPANIPVAFELTILFSAFTTFLGMWALNGLPKLSNPLFNSERFDRVTNDRFFLHVDSRDKYFNRESVKDLLAGTKPESLEEVIEDSSPSALPSVIWLGLGFLFCASLVPVAVVLNMRAGNDENPRWHVFFDMDFQPKKKAQQTTTIFADARISRPQVPGTVARGSLVNEDPFYLGYDPAKQASLNAASNVRLVSAAEEDKAVKSADTSPDTSSDKTGSVDSAKTSESDKPVEPAKVEEPAKADEPAKAVEPVKVVPPTNPPAATAAPSTAPATPAAAAPPAAGGPNLPWITEFPLEVDASLIALGKTKFEIYCSVCHGYAGDGDGLVHRRAEQLQQGYWLPPTSVHDPRIQEQAIGNIFYTISNGKGKMAGYATVLSPKERWAIVSYVRALQRSRNAKIDDVPVEMRARIEEAKIEEAKKAE
jgi:mono/diheme cytochrome c family protein